MTAGQSTFRPITPCRIVNTTLAGGILANGATRTYYVGGTIGFIAQGGKGGGCGIPVGATAIAATVTAATPLQHGFLRMWPAGQTEPNATILSYPQGIAGNTGATIGIATGAAKALTVKNHGGPAHLIIDVTGYYSEQMHALVGMSGLIYSGSGAAVSAGSINAAEGYFKVTWNRDVEFCTAVVDPFSGNGIYATANNLNGKQTQVYMWTLDPTTHAVKPITSGLLLLHHRDLLTIRARQYWR